MKSKFTTVNGLMWPAYDTQMKRFLHTAVDINAAMKYVTNKRTVIQAGGACGIWAKKLAEDFDTVYTFEPDPLNFTCLAHNLVGLDHKVVKTQAALGDRHQMIGMHIGKRADNAGAQHADPATPGSIPMLMIDDFELDNVDLIILDIEGWEPAAIKGGERVIKACRPVVMIEAKPLPHMGKLGIDKDTAGRLLESWGYTKVERIHRDDIFVHEQPDPAE